MADGAKSLERRTASRFPVHAPTRLHVQLDGAQHSCRIEDISMSGLRLRWDEPMPQSAWLPLTHAVAGNLASQTVWQRNGELGATFNSDDDAIGRMLKIIYLLLHPDDLSGQPGSIMAAQL